MEIAVPELDAFGPGKANPVHDARVVLLICQNRILPLHERCEHPDIRRIPTSEVECRFRSFESGKPAFHLRKGRALSPQKARGSGSASLAQDGVSHLPLQEMMICESEIVVGRKIDSAGWLESSSQPGKIQFSDSIVNPVFELGIWRHAINP